jgi:GNAT superfamily N-acetyltransferase
MHLRQLEPSDFDAITTVVDDWWGGRPMRGLLPRLFFDHFADTSLVAEDDGRLIGFLIGFRSPARAGEAYIHFVGVHPGHRQRGVARALYTRFFALMQQQGCVSARCITALINRASIAFHTRMGFALEPGATTIAGVAFTPAYDGPGHDRVQFVKRLTAPDAAADARYGVVLHQLAAIARDAFAAGRLAEALAALDQGRAIAARDNAHPAARAAFLVAAGRIAGWHASLCTGDYGQARHDIDAAHALARAADDATLGAQALDALGFVQYQQALTAGDDDFAPVAALARQAHDLYQAQGDARGVWSQRFRLALVEERARRFEAAATTMARVYDAARALGDLHLQAEAARHQGFAAWRAGDLPTAHARLAESLALLEQAGQRAFTPFAHLSLGDIALARRQLDAADQHFALALELAAQCGATRAAVQTRCSLGELREAQGRDDDARALYQEALDGAHAIGFASGAARIEALLRQLNGEGAGYAQPG